MKPYYQDDACTIYHGDCREILPQLEPVDLVLTDPPYGLNIAANPFRQKFTSDNWDLKPADKELLFLSMGLAKESIIWGGNYFPLPCSQGFLAWDKEQPEDFSSSMIEIAWWSEPSPAKIYKKRVVGYFKEHPTQKPVDLMQWCIRKAKCDPQTILDPFMGSGTTGVAAMQLGRNFIGCELDATYFAIAEKRIREAQAQLRLF